MTNCAIHGYILGCESMKLTFIELPAFMSQIDKLGKPLSDETLSAIESDLLKHRSAVMLLRGLAEREKDGSAIRRN